MDDIKIIKYGDKNTVNDYETLRQIAYKENVMDNILIGTVQFPRYNLYLLYNDGNCIGFGGYKRSKKEQLSHNYTFENFYILKDLQGQGIMGKLYNFLENEILNNGDKIVRLECKVTETNEKSLRFCKKHGFYQYGFAKNRIYDKNNNKYLGTILLEKIIEL